MRFAGVSLVTTIYMFLSARELVELGCPVKKTLPPLARYPPKGVRRLVLELRDSDFTRLEQAAPLQATDSCRSERT